MKETKIALSGYVERAKDISLVEIVFEEGKVKYHVTGYLDSYHSEIGATEPSGLFLTAEDLRKGKGLAAAILKYQTGHSLYGGSWKDLGFKSEKEFLYRYFRADKNRKVLIAYDDKTAADILLKLGEEETVLVMTGPFCYQECRTVDGLLLPEDRFGWAVNLTTTKDAEEAYTGELDIISAVFQEMESDDDGRSSKLISDYRHGDARERAIMDSVLIDLCGWSFHSLVEIARNNGLKEES